MCPKIVWLTSTTGASAHWPKHATVRSVVSPSGVVTDSCFRLAVLAGLQPEAHHRRLQQVARAAGVAGGAAADADGVAALRLEVEQRVEGDHAVDPRQGGRRFRGDVLKDRRRQIVTRLVLLDFVQDAQQSAGPAGSLGDDRIDECLVEILGSLHGDTLHGSSHRLTRSRLGNGKRTPPMFRKVHAGPRDDRRRRLTGGALGLAAIARDSGARALDFGRRIQRPSHPARDALQAHRKRRAAPPRACPTAGDAAKCTLRHYSFSPSVHRPHRW